MIEFTKRIDDPSGIVSKMIFEDKGAIAEAVVYRYANRGVICFSVQSGCPVGCVFCGTGRTFIRNLSWMEMVRQIETCLPIVTGREKVQLMAMSMGEPLYNFDALPVNYYLSHGYYFFISSVGLERFDYGHIMVMASLYGRFGFQISLHHWDEDRRRALLGNHGNLASIQRLMEIADEYREACGRPMYFNYIATGEETEEDARRIGRIVSHGHITVSVMCATHLAPSNRDPANRLCAMLLDINPEQPIKMFDPAGQDTIGGGCGQLVYVQEKFKQIKEGDE